MILSTRLTEAFNTQCNQEMSNARTYKALAGFFDDMNLVGFAKFMRKQEADEYDHHNRIYEYLADRNAHIVITELPRPALPALRNPVDAFQAALELERRTSTEINTLAGLALDERDFVSFQFMDWLLAEQVEEEAKLIEWLSKFAIAGDDPAALLALNRELEHGGQHNCGPCNPGA